MVEGQTPAISARCDITALESWHGGRSLVVHYTGTAQVWVRGANFPPNHFIFVELQSEYRNAAPRALNNEWGSQFDLNAGRWTISDARGQLAELFYPNVKFHMTDRGLISTEFRIKAYVGSLFGGLYNNNLPDPPDNMESLQVRAQSLNKPDLDRDCQWPYGMRIAVPEGSRPQYAPPVGAEKQEQQNKMLQEDKTSAVDETDIEQGTLPSDVTEPDLTEPDNVTEGQGQIQDGDQTKEK